MKDKVYINGKNAEIERRWLIKIPNMAELEKQKDCNVSSIEQIYISDNGSFNGDRIRKRDFAGSVKYYRTHKERINYISCYEDEREITAEEYERLSALKLEHTAAIRKKRCCFEYGGNTVEIDIYDFWNDKAIMEIELSEEEQAVRYPDFIEVITEITGDESYSNYALACKK